jgi:hypothetical protein
MRGRIATPPAAQIARLQPSLHATAFHEAGHALAGLVLDIPLACVWIAYQLHGWSGWSVVGRTETVIDGEEPPPGEMSVRDLNDAILFVRAGLEAEAMCLAARDGLRLPAARRVVAGVKVHQRGDLAQLRGYHRDPRAQWSERQAQETAHGLLVANWPAVERIAQHLMKDRQLSGKRIAQLI